METTLCVDEPISVYTRADALHAGMLIDVSGIAEAEGIAVPVAMTAAALQSIGPSVEERCLGVDPQVRLRELFGSIKHALRQSSYIEAGRIELRMVLAEDGKRVSQDLFAALHRGDRGEPVVTIMLPEEDLR